MDERTPGKRWIEIVTTGDDEVDAAILCMKALANLEPDQKLRTATYVLERARAALLPQIDLKPASDPDAN